MAERRGVFVGLATLDLGSLVERYPSEDTKSTALAQFTAAGGPAVNAAVTFSFLAGGGAQLVTGLGTHFLADVVRDDLRRHAVSLVDLAAERTQPPPVSSIITSRDNGSRTVVSRDASGLAVPATRYPETLLRDAAIVLVDGHLAEVSRSVAQAARKAGVPVIFDGGRWKPSDHDLLTYVDIAICARSFRPPALTGGWRGVHAYLHEAGVRMVATTDGAGPVRFSTGTLEGTVAVPQTEVIDTLGAGDIFHGAFCHHYLAGHRFGEALARAAVVASASCASFGTREWMHSAMPDRHAEHRDP